MRTAFISELIAQAERDPKIWLLTADLGFSALEPFAEKFPDRYVNVGVAEQNMVGIAAGLAHSGKQVFTYSIGNFSTMRCLEQIRNDVCYHRMNVKIVAVGAGFAYGPQGYTHHVIEDLAVMRTLPGMKTLTPADPLETHWITQQAVADTGPCYLRLGKAGEQNLRAPEDFHPPRQLGDPICLKSGHDAQLFGTGSLLRNALDAASALEKSGISLGVWSVPCLNPLNEEMIFQSTENQSVVFTFEEHNNQAGLGGRFAELYSSIAGGPRLCRIGVENAPPDVYGDQDHLRRWAGLDPETLSQRIIKELQPA